MLCGCCRDQVGTTPDEVAAGPVGRLIDWLENDGLDYRVLAVQNLAEITGIRLMPNPAASPMVRARGVRLWRARLKAGDVMPL
jgi:hypothetical protein